MTSNARKQANVRAGKGGVVPPKEHQFGQPNGNPRHNGAWKKEDTLRYKLEQMLKLTEEELKAIAKDESASFAERKLATMIAKADWKTFEGMANQAYGAPKQPQEITVADLPTPLVDLRKKKK